MRIGYKGKRKKFFYGRIIKGPKQGEYGVATKMTDSYNFHVGWNVVNKDDRATFFIRLSAFEICTKQEYLTAQVIKS